MESNEMVQQELNQTTTDLLLQESIQTNQKLEELQNILTSIKDLKIILPESIENVMFEQLKKLQDLQENSLKQSKEELQRNKEQHNLQMNELKNEFSQKIEIYKNQTEVQLSRLRKENQEVIVEDCKQLFNDAESKISKVVENTTRDFESAAKTTERMNSKNLLFNFITSIVLIAATICGYLYVQNYRDGSKIAEEMAVEALATERTKFNDEMKNERMKLENEMNSKREQIEMDAIDSYMNSDSFREDACKLVASNINKIDCLHYMYIYTKSDDIKNYPALKEFYNSFLKKGDEQYKKMLNK